MKVIKSVCLGSSIFSADLQVSQKTQIGGNLVGGSTEAGQGSQRVDVNLNRISMGSDRV